MPLPVRDSVTPTCEHPVRLPCERLVAMSDAAGIYETLSVDECLELLKAHQFGRVAVVIDGQPIIFPVNYAIDGDAVVFRTDPGSKLSGAAMGRVAFEVDGVDESDLT